MRIAFWWFDLYTLKVAGGLVVASLWLWWRAPRYGIDRTIMRGWLVAVTVAALVGGRMGYVLGNGAYFVQHPADIAHWRQASGLHGSSAILGGLCVAVVWSRRANLSLRTVLGLLTPPVLCVAAAAWWGCVNVGCAWGREVVVATGWQRLFVAEMPDIYRMMAQLYAVQPFGAGVALVWAGLAAALRERGGLVLSLYLLCSAGLTLLRADGVPVTGVVRSDTVLDLALAGAIAMGLGRDAHSTAHK